MRLCSVEGCGSKYHARGYCSKHYGRMRNSGTPEGLTLERRFWNHITVDDETGCWNWDTHGSHGYGQFKGDLAHRVSYEVFVGPIPDGLHIDHLCRNRRCANPEHLEPVTPQENLLRSPITHAGRNASKTHCLREHEFTSANTYLTKDGRRQCRRCMAIRDANHQMRRAGKLAAA